MITQTIILICFIIYIILVNINTSENYSKKAIEDFKSNRNWNIFFAIILFIFLYFAGTFDKIF